MKKRTRVIAYIWMAFSVFSLIVYRHILAPAALWVAGLVFPYMQASPPAGKSIAWWVGILADSLVWLLWWGLLKQKAWAWKVLVVIYGAGALERTWILATAPAYYAAHPEVERPVVAFALTLFWALIFVGIPLWALLTDPPAKWSSPMKVSSTPGVELSD